MAVQHQDHWGRMKPWVATVPRMAQLKSVKKPRMAQQRASWPHVVQQGGVKAARGAAKGVEAARGAAGDVGAACGAAGAGTAGGVGGTSLGRVATMRDCMLLTVVPAGSKCGDGGKGTTTGLVNSSKNRNPHVREREMFPQRERKSPQKSHGER